LADRFGVTAPVNGFVNVAGCVEGAPEALEDLIPLVGRRAVGHEIVVVEAHAVRPEVGQPLDRVDRVERCAHFGAEGISAGVPDRPEPEGEVILWLGGEGISHGPPVVAAPGALVVKQRTRCPRQGPMIALSDRNDRWKWEKGNMGRHAASCSRQETLRNGGVRR